jgi:2-phosphoglycolate phosphatase
MRSSSRKEVEVTKPRAIVCDFDGTLADSYAGITASVNFVRASHRLPPVSEADVRPHVGRGPTHLLVHTVPAGDPEANVALYRKHHPSVMFSGTRLFPGVASTLKRLHEAGLKLAICSNKPVVFTKQLVEHFGLAPCFNAVVGPEDAPRPKPAPDMLLEAMKRLAVTPAETLYVGDMTVDIATARAAGVSVWVIPSGSDSPDSLAAAKPDRILGDFAELASLVA